MHWYWQLKICIQSFINNPQNFNGRWSVSFLICLRVPDLHKLVSSRKGNDRSYEKYIKEKNGQSKLTGTGEKIQQMSAYVSMEG